MRTSTLAIFALFVICICSCKQQNNNPFLFKNPSLNDSLVRYITIIKDIPNPVNNPTTTFITVFERKDSTIVTFDSQPENERSLIPGIDCGFDVKKIKKCSGYFQNKPVFIRLEGKKYYQFINLSAVMSFSNLDKEKFKKMPTANDTGWRDNKKYYRQYYLSDSGSVVLLKSFNPI